MRRFLAPTAQPTPAWGIQHRDLAGAEPRARSACRRHDCGGRQRHRSLHDAQYYWSRCAHPCFSNYFRSTSSSTGSGILINIDTYRELQHDPASGTLDPDADIYTKLLSKVQTGVSETAVLRDLRSYMNSTASSMSVTATSESVTSSRAQLQQQRIFITLLTALSMVTAIFGVLAFDFNTAGIILVLVCFAAVFSASLATQPVIAQKAIKILHER